MRAGDDAEGLVEFVPFARRKRGAGGGGEDGFPVGVAHRGDERRGPRLGPVVLHPGAHAHGAALCANLGRGDKRAALVFGRTLERHVQFVRQHEAHIAVDAPVNIEVARGHRRDRAVGIVAAVRDLDGEDVVRAVEFHVRCDVEGEARVAALVFAGEGAVHVDLRVFLDAVELEKDEPLRVLGAEAKFLPIPAPAIPPIGVVVLGRIADEKMRLARRLVGAPRMRHRDGRPIRVIVTRRGDAQIGLLVGRIQERPVAVYSFLDPRRGGKKRRDEDEQERAERESKMRHREKERGCAPESRSARSHQCVI